MSPIKGWRQGLNQVFECANQEQSQKKIGEEYGKGLVYPENFKSFNLIKLFTHGTESCQIQRSWSLTVSRIADPAAQRIDWSTSLELNSCGIDCLSPLIQNKNGVLLKTCYIPTPQTRFARWWMYCLCAHFSDFFVSKIRNLKRTIMNRTN